MLKSHILHTLQEKTPKFHFCVGRSKTCFAKAGCANQRPPIHQKTPSEGHG